MILFRKKEFVFAHHWHGAATLSHGGYCRQYSPGLAAGAEYLLARTERILWEPHCRRRILARRRRMGWINTEQILFPVHWVIPTAGILPQIWMVEKSGRACR